MKILIETISLSFAEVHQDLWTQYYTGEYVPTAHEFKSAINIPEQV